MTNTIVRASAVGLLLAAGRGKRFDSTGERNKLLASVDGQAVAGASARNMHAAGIDVIAVVRPDSDELTQTLKQAGCMRVVVSELADQGMGHSLADGVRAIQSSLDPDRIVISLADMPFIEPDTYRAVVDSIDESQTIAAAFFNEQRGHPVGFWRTHFDALMASTGDTGAGRLLKQHEVVRIPVNDPGVVRDIDRPEDLTNHAS